MNPIYTILSLLTLIGGNSLNILKSGMRKYQKQSVEFSTQILLKNLDKRFIAQRIFITPKINHYLRCSYQ